MLEEIAHVRGSTLHPYVIFLLRTPFFWVVKVRQMLVTANHSVGVVVAGWSHCEPRKILTS